MLDRLLLGLSSSGPPLSISYDQSFGEGSLPLITRVVTSGSAVTPEGFHSPSPKLIISLIDQCLNKRDSPPRVLDDAHPPRLSKRVSNKPFRPHPSQSRSFDSSFRMMLFSKSDDFASLSRTEKGAGITGGQQRYQGYILTRRMSSDWDGE